MLRILIVDDHEVVRLGLRTLLSNHHDFSVVDGAASAEEALEKVRLHHPDVVVLDIRLPGANGIKACEMIKQKYPATHVIMLTSYAEDEMLFEAISAGADGYVLKQVGSNDLVKAIRCVGRGEALLDPAVTQRVLKRVRRATQQEQVAAFSKLTAQEARVLAHVAEGMTNKQVSQALYLGEGTVRNYVSSILAKLELTNRAEAAAYSVRHNLEKYMAEFVEAD
ncbi:MAG TPA: response regulator transcription factor [Thermoflexia bacterium]|nr:response regulator transcription factor [Thermoflexia bacterium]